MPIGSGGGDIQFGVKITADNSVFVDGVRASSEEIKKLGDGLKQVAQDAGGATKSQESLTGAVAKGTIAVDVLGKAVDTAVGLYRDMRDATREAQQAQLSFEAVLKSTGNAASLSYEHIRAIAESMQHLAGFDDGAVTRAAAALATFGNVGGDAFERILRLAGDMSKVFGGDLQSNVLKLAKAYEAPGEALGQLERTMGKFGLELRSSIKDMETWGETAAAGDRILDAVQKRVGGAATESYRGLERQLQGTKLAFDDLMKAVGSKVFDAQSRDASLLENTLRALTSVINDTHSAWSKLMVVARSMTPQALMVGSGGPIGALFNIAGQAELDAAYNANPAAKAGPGGGNLEDFQAKFDQLAARYDKMRAFNDALRETATLVVKLGKEGTPEAQALFDSIIASYTKAAPVVKAAKDEIGDLIDRLESKSLGASGEFQKNQEALIKGFATGKISVAQFTAAMMQLTSQQPFVTDYFRAAEKSAADLQSTIAKLNAARAKDLQTILDEVEKEDLANRTRGMTKSQIEDITIARAEERLEQMRSIEGSESEVRALELQIAARKRLRASMSFGEIAAATEEANKKALQDQISTWTQLGDAAGRFFSDLVFHGRGAFKSLGDMLKQFLAQLIQIFATRWVLQLGMAATGNSALGAAANQVGQGTASGTFGNIASSALGYVGTGVTAGGSFATGFSAGAAGLGGTEFTGMAALGEYVGTAYGAVMDVLAAIPVWGWIAAAVVAIAAWFAGQGGGPKTGGSFSSMGSPDRLFTPDQADTQLGTFVDSGIATYGKIAQRLGGSPGTFDWQLGFDNDPEGSARSRTSARLTDASGKVVYSNLDRQMDDKEVPAALALELKRETLAALEATDLGPELNKYFGTIGDIAKLSSDDIDRILAHAMELHDVVLGLKDLGLKGLDLTALQSWQHDGESIGQTFQRIATTWSAFEDAFTNGDQKIERARQAVNATFGELGLAVPQSTQAFYDLVKGLDLSTQAGRDTFDALMAVAPAFQTVTTAAENAVATFNSLVSSLSPVYAQQITHATLWDDIGRWFGMTGETGRDPASFIHDLEVLLAGGTANGGTINDVLNFARNLGGQAAVDLINRILADYSAWLNSMHTGGTTTGPGTTTFPGTTLPPPPDQWPAARQNVGDYLNNLFLDPNKGGLDARQRLKLSGDAFWDLIGKANAGDLGAAGKLSGAADTYLGIARENYGSSSDYILILKSVTDALASFSSTPDYNARMVSANEGMLAEMKSFNTSLGDVKLLLQRIADQAPVHAETVAQAAIESGAQIAQALQAGGAPLGQR